jgi:DNA-binding PadR family transcriptional regulator
MTSPLDLAVLGLLTEQDLHGYELKKRLGELLGSKVSTSFGSLYPALARLEKQGALKVVEGRTATQAPKPAPMSGSLAGELAAFRSRVREAGLSPGGRGRKVYGITDIGRERLVEALADPDVGDDRTFNLRVAFASHLSAAQRLDLFEQRRAELIRRRGEHARERRGRGPLDTYRRALLERDVASIDSDLTWLDGLIAGERQLLEEPR